MRYKVTNWTIGFPRNVSKELHMAVATAAEQAAPGSKHNIEGSRQAYYDKIAKFHMAPLWEVLKGLVTPEPKTKYKAAVWKFADSSRFKFPRNL